MATVFRHLDQGPGHKGDFVSDSCRDSPWKNLLYIQNLVEGGEYPSAPIPQTIANNGGCVPQSWYMGNDMQFFILAPPIIYVLWKWKRIGLALVGNVHAN